MRDDRRVLLGLVAPFDLLRIEIHGEHLVGERSMQIHCVAYYERRSLVTTKHAGGKHPGNLHLAHVLGVDLGERAVALVIHIASLHRVVFRIGNQFFEIRIRPYHARNRQQPRRCQRSLKPRPIYNLHTSSCGHPRVLMPVENVPARSDVRPACKHVVRGFSVPPASDKVNLTTTTLAPRAKGPST